MNLHRNIEDQQSRDREGALGGCDGVGTVTVSVTVTDADADADADAKHVVVISTGPLPHGRGSERPYGRSAERLVSNTSRRRGIMWRCLAFATVICLSPVAYGQVTSMPNGVASGDVDRTSVVLWTRSTTLGPVSFEYSTDSEFARIDGSATASVVDADIPVKVELRNLQPNTPYFYRVSDAAGGVLTGAFRTLAVSGLNGLRFGVSGDSRGDLRPFVSIANVPGRDLGFFIELGDTVYADWPFNSLAASQSRTISEMRARHIEVYSELHGVNGLADLRAATSIYAVIDDHEVTNDFEGGEPPSGDARFDQTGDFINETDLYRNGLQAFHEYNPIRTKTYGDTGDPRTANKPKLYRFRTFGSDAALILLDARSFRDASLDFALELTSLPEYIAFLERSFDPTRTMLGDVQIALLENDLLEAEAQGITWKFIVVPEPIQLIGPALARDRFEGYAFERTRILRFITENDIENVVFLSADIHASVVNNLTYQDTATSRPINTRAFEVVTGPIAFAAPFGPTVIGFAPPLVRDIHDRLGRIGQNNLYRTLATVLLDFYRLPRFGLQQSPIDAELLFGDYFWGNTYGWSEFDIDATTQCLTVTTWGIPWYNGTNVATRPNYVLNLTPEVISQFRVRPTLREGMVAFDDDIEVCRPRGTPCGVLGFPTLMLTTSMCLAMCICRASTRQERMC